MNRCMQNPSPTEIENRDVGARSVMVNMRYEWVSGTECTLHVYVESPLVKSVVVHEAQDGADAEGGAER